MVCLNSHQFALIFGILGNIVGFFVYLAPLPTFVIICKNKSSAGFQSIPYSAALSNAMLMLYYGFLKTNATMRISINAFGCAIELTYLFIHMIYGSWHSKMQTLKLLLLFNIGGLCTVVAFTTLFLESRKQRVAAVGWICVAFNLALFAAPLAIMRKVIKTKSVEFMPFTVSLFLTMNAVIWFFYAFFVKDKFIAIPNIAGFLIGLAQMILYMVYRNSKNKTTPTVQPANVEDEKLESTDNQMKIEVEEVRLNNNSNNV